MLEREIINSCSRLILEQFKSTKYIVKLDYEMGFDFGIADILIFWVSKELLEKRKISEIKKPILNFLSYYIFFNAPKNREFEFNELLELLNIKDNDTAKYIKYNNIKYLVKNNYFLQIHRNLYIKNNNYINPVKKIFAFEIKISDWKSGIIQAKRYKSYADESYLGIWDRFLGRALKNIDLFEINNIGLLSLGETKVRKKIKPKINSNIIDFNRSLASEFLLGKSLT